MMIGKMKIIVTESESFSKEAFAILSSLGEVSLLNVDSRQSLMEECRDAEVLFVRLGFKIDSEIIDQLPNLKYILSATTGTDHINLDYFEQKGGKIICLKGETEFLGSIPSTAEHTWALLLSLIKKIPSSFDHIKSGQWNRNLFKGNNLKGKRLGILGMGRVGMQVAKFATAFEMEVGFYDTDKKEVSYQNFDSPEKLFSWSEIICIHIPLDSKNENFVNEELLGHVRKDVLIINTSRGNVWDENYIAQKIRDSDIAGVATDVLQNELDLKILKESSLINLSKQGFNVIITPHIAGATYESMAMTEEFIAEKLKITLSSSS